MEMLQTGRIQIAYEASGSGEVGAVILIRGQGTQLSHWPESFYEAFASRGFLTLRFDNRDTGLSSKFDHIAGRELEALKQRLAAGDDIDPPYTMDDMARDVVALMDELDIESAHIVGIFCSPVTEEWATTVRSRRPTAISTPRWSSAAMIRKRPVTT